MGNRTDQFTLLNWNVFQGLHHRRGMNDVSASIKAIGGDVLVIQELWHYRQTQSFMAEDLADELGFELHQWISDEPSRGRDISPWRIAILTGIPAERLDTQLMPRIGKFGPRAVVRVRLRESGLVVAGSHFYGIHATRRHPRGWLRERAAMGHVAATNDVVAADFNMWSPLVHRDMAPLRPAIAGRTWPAHRPHSQIDHIMVSDRVEVHAAEVLPDLGSDHRPLRVSLSARSPASSND